MKITVNGKEYEAGKITAGMTRRALELNAEALDAAKKAEELKKSADAENASELLALLGSNIEQKAALACDAFGGAFDSAALLDSVTNAELNGIIQQIATGKN